MWKKYKSKKHYSDINKNLMNMLLNQQITSHVINRNFLFETKCETSSK